MTFGCDVRLMVDDNRYWVKLFSKSCPSFLPGPGLGALLSSYLEGVL